MKKQPYILICLLIMMLFLNACGNNGHVEETSMGKDSNESNEVVNDNENRENIMEGKFNEIANGVRMSREYIIENGLATEEELEGVDIDRMILDCGWVEGLEEQCNIALMITSLKRDYLFEDNRLDYLWLTSTTEQEEKVLKEDIDQIKVIGFEYQSGNNPVSSMVFDFEEQKAYYGDLFLGKIEPEKEFFLTDDQINEIREIISNCAVYEWETRYEGTNGDTTGSFWWSLYYALEDGRIYSNSGSGVLGNSTLDNYDILEKGLEAFWKEQQ